MATPTVLFAPQALDIVRTAATSRPTLTHDDAVGGLLIGKREDGAIVVLAATEPGPNADDRRLGVALDVGYINAVLEAWFARDPDADIVGMWHTHPHDVDDLTLDDVAAAYTLHEDTGRDIVFALAAHATPDTLQCYYLDADSTQGVGLMAVPYRVEGDVPVVTPVLLPVPGTPAPTEPRPAAPTEPASPPAASIPSEPPTGTTVDDALTASPPPDSQTWTNDETDLVLPAARVTDTTPPVAADGSNRRIIMWAVYAVIALLVLFGLWRFFGGSGNAPTPDTTATVVGGAVVVTSAPAAPTAPPTVAPTDAPTVAPTSTTAPTPTEAATVAPTVAVVQTATVETSATVEAATSAGAVATSAATAGAVVTSVAGSQPYVMVWTPMSDAESTAFLARARAADCADCYNIDLIGPDPYRELRVRIDGRAGTAALRTFDRPALALVPPRAEPHTLQVYTTQNNVASTPMTVTVASGAYYILRIEAAP